MHINRHEQIFVELIVFKKRTTCICNSHRHFIYFFQFACFAIKKQPRNFRANKLNLNLYLITIYYDQKSNVFI